jgi:hypothetical protein
MLESAKLAIDEQRLLIVEVSIWEVDPPKTQLSFCHKGLRSRIAFLKGDVPSPAATRGPLRNTGEAARTQAQPVRS